MKTMLIKSALKMFSVYVSQMTDTDVDHLHAFSLRAQPLFALYCDASVEASELKEALDREINA